MLENWQWSHIFRTWRHRLFFFFFLRCFYSIVSLSYWSKFNVNIITGSAVVTIFFYNRLTTNPEIGNTPIWAFPNIWRLGGVRETKFGTNVSNKMLLKAAKCQGYSIFWVIKGKPTKQTPQKSKIYIKNTHFIARKYDITRIVTKIDYIVTCVHSSKMFFNHSIYKKAIENKFYCCYRIITVSSHILWAL